MPAFFQNDYFKDRTVMVEKLDMFPFEFVVRGYLFGSMWEAYKNGESFCQLTLPDNYKLAQKLEHPILTPALKHDVGHDEYVGIKEVESRLGSKITEQITESCLKLYEVCSEYAFSKGLIIADAKFEFGQDKQFLRDWLLANKVNGEFQFDKVPESVLNQTEKIYKECLEELTK